VVENAKGHRVGFPRYRKKGIRDRFRYGTGSFGPVDSRHVKLPRIGLVRTKESTVKLLDRLVAGTARITSATVSREADRWFVSFGAEVSCPTPIPLEGDAVGIDRGIKSFASLSDGTVIKHPGSLGVHLRKLRRMSRAHSRKRKGSANRRKSSLRLARLHRRIRNERRDFLHKSTTRLAKSKAVIVIEDLSVKNLLRNRRLARHISDAAWGEFARMIAYKTQWYGSRLLVADRYFPSSKTCSACGFVRAKLSLTERVFSCDRCEVVLDRDLNAAKNLARLALPVAVSSPETKNACGAGSFMAKGQVPSGEAGTELRSRGRLREFRGTAAIL
jgi:putative transposase